MAAFRSRSRTEPQSGQDHSRSLSISFLFIYPQTEHNVLIYADQQKENIDLHFEFYPWRTSGFTYIWMAFCRICLCMFLIQCFFSDYDDLIIDLKLISQWQWHITDIQHRGKLSYCILIYLYLYLLFT
jgi:hypothetical protein